MILHVTVLLLFQLLGEILTRAAGLTLPGPVLGMAMLLVVFMARPGWAEAIRPTAQGLLSNLSLLFVPAGVGIVGHLNALDEHLIGILLAIVVSTGLAIAVSSLVFVGVARLMGVADD